jgi:tetratricopeptide (TPR) repeat protein
VSCSFRPVTAGLIFLFVGCRSEAPPRAIERLALLPFENLTGDRSLDWLSEGAQVLLNRQLAPSRLVAVSAYPNLAEAVLGRATRFLHGTIEKRAGGFRLEAVLEDGITHRQSGERIELTLSEGQLLGGLSQVAKRLASDAATTFPPQPAALEALVEARSRLQPEAKLSGLARAAQLDPQFGLAAITLAETSITAGRLDEARAAVAAAASRQLDPIEREQVALLAANLAGDRAAQAQALVKLAAAAPSQANLQFFVASRLEVLHRPLEAVTAFERATKIDPENTAVLNRLAYANAYAGRLPAARQALETYQRLAPDDANALDSLGEVHYLSGEFGKAAEFFQGAYSKSPQFDGGRALLKAAYARLLDGQFAPAAQTLEQYSKVHANLPAMEVARAHFLYASGDRKAALGALTDAAAKSTGAVASLYHSHRCGLLLSHDRPGAAAAARAAAAAAPTPPAIFCAFLSQPSASPAGWTARAEQSVAPNFRRQALAYALFHDGHFADAFPLIEGLAMESSPDADSEFRVLLAECQWRTGRWPSARETVARWPLPAVDSIFAGRHVPSFLRSTLKTAERFENNAVIRRWTTVSEKVLRALN